MNGPAGIGKRRTAIEHQGGVIGGLQRPVGIGQHAVAHADGQRHCLIRVDRPLVDKAAVVGGADVSCPPDSSLVRQKGIIGLAVSHDAVVGIVRQG